MSVIDDNKKNPNGTVFGLFTKIRNKKSEISVQMRVLKWTSSCYSAKSKKVKKVVK